MFLLLFSCLFVVSKNDFVVLWGHVLTSPASGYHILSQISAIFTFFFNAFYDVLDAPFTFQTHALPGLCHSWSLEIVESLLNIVHGNDEAHDQVVLVDTVLPGVGNLVLSEDVPGGLDLFSEPGHLRSKLVDTLGKPAGLVGAVLAFPGCFVDREVHGCTLDETVVNGRLEQKDAVLL